MNTTTPKPPKGRRWLRVGEIIRKWDRFQDWADLKMWVHTRNVGGRVPFAYEYSRAIRRKTTRK